MEWLTSFCKQFLEHELATAMHCSTVVPPQKLVDWISVPIVWTVSIRGWIGLEGLCFTTPWIIADCM